MEAKETNGNGKHSTAIELAKPNMARAYEPQNYAEALQMAKTLAGSSLLGALKSPEAVFLVMATGAELGIPPTAALRGVHIIEGKPSLSADLIVALCLKSPLCEYFTCKLSNDKEATYETKRVNSGPVSNTFTMEDAKRAGVDQKKNWTAYGKAMLRHRASAELARMVYPDLVLGIYAEEEMIEAGPPATAIEAPRPQEVIDADVVTPPAKEEDSITKITAAFLDVQTIDECDALAARVAKLGLAEDSDDRKALLQLYKETARRVKAAK